MEKSIAIKFLNRFCGVVRRDNGDSIFSKGIVSEVTDETLLLDYYGSVQAIALETIINIREVKNER